MSLALSDSDAFSLSSRDCRTDSCRFKKATSASSSAALAGEGMLLCPGGGVQSPKMPTPSAFVELRLSHGERFLFFAVLRSWEQEGGRRGEAGHKLRLLWWLEEYSVQGGSSRREEQEK